MHDGVHDVPFLENGRPGSVLLTFVTRTTTAKPAAICACGSCAGQSGKVVEVPARGAGQCFKHNNEAKASKQEIARTTLQSQAQSPRTNF